MIKIIAKRDLTIFVFFFFNVIIRTFNVKIIRFNPRPNNNYIKILDTAKISFLFHLKLRLFSVNFFLIFFFLQVVSRRLQWTTGRKHNSRCKYYMSDKNMCHHTGCSFLFDIITAAASVRKY